MLMSFFTIVGSGGRPSLLRADDFSLDLGLIIELMLHY